MSGPSYSPGVLTRHDELGEPRPCSGARGQPGGSRICRRPRLFRLVILMLTDDAKGIELLALRHAPVPCERRSFEPLTVRSWLA